MRDMRAAASATDRATRDAVHRAVTIEYATVAAVTSTGVTLTMPDGSSVPGVPVLHPYVPRAGAEVRVAVQGGALLVLGAVKPDPRPTTVTYYEAGPVSTTSTSYVSLSPTPARVAFVAPPSGAAIFHTKARLTPTATARAVATGRLLTAALATLTTTTVLVEVPAGAGTMTAGASFRFTGLTPGATYYAETVYASGTSGQSVSISAIYMIVQPEV